MTRLGGTAAAGRSRAVAAVLSVLFVAGGCTPAALPDVRIAAERFQNALRGGDATAACSMLSAEARSRLELTSARRCDRALDALKLPADSPTEVEVWGDNAQARLPDGVLFLAEFPTGWKVTGAGCRSRPEMPYACAVRS